MSLPPKVDVHHHIVPPQLLGVGEGLNGMKAPDWTFLSDEAYSQSIGVGMRMFSVSAPGVTYIEDATESAGAARSMNEYSAAIRDAHPKSCGFFATVPSLEHTELVLQEIQYALDDLHADGVTLFTSYGAQGGGYLGHEQFVPIWKELNARKAVVFVHPVDNGKHFQGFNDKMHAAPAFDWPHETGRTAMDMILNRRLQQFPDVKIILSHAGGTLPILARRCTMIAEPEFGEIMSAEDIYGQAKCFYFDTAISGSEEVFPLIVRFAKPGHLLFGSDFPHLPPQLGKVHTSYIDKYPLDDEVRNDIYYGAAAKLFPRLKGAFGP